MHVSRRRRRAPLLTAILTIGLLGALAGPASANTVLLVNGTTGTDAGANTCRLTPCKTIQYAIVQGRSVADGVTINVAAGAYVENILLTSADSGLRIEGAGNGADPGANTVVTAVSPGPAITTTTASALFLSRLRLANTIGNPAPVLTGNTDLGLEDVVIDDQGNAGAIQLGSGDLVARGGSITVAASSSGGEAIFAGSGSVTLTGTPVVVRGTGSGVYAGGRLSVTGAPVRLENPTNSNYALYAGKGGEVTDVPVEHRGTGYGVYASNGSLVLSGGSVSLTNSSSSQYAVYASSGSIRATNTPVTHAGTGYGLYAGSAGIDVTGGSVKLTNTTNSGYAIYSSGAVRTTNTEVLHAGTGYGVYASNGAADLTGGSITLSNPTNSSYAIYASNGAVTTRNTTVLQAGTSYGLYASNGQVDLAGGSITLPNTANSGYAVYGGNGDVALSDLALTSAGTGFGVFVSNGSLTLRRATVVAGNPTGSIPAVYVSSGRVTIEDSTITSTSKGPALEGSGSASITGSSITGGAPGASAAAVRLADTGSNGHAVLLRRSIIRQSDAGQPNLQVDRMNLTVDSSELLGGTGLAFLGSSGTSRLLAVAGSTLDAGALGVRDGALRSLTVATDNTVGTFARGTVQGSILVEAPAATRAGANSTSSVVCTNTEAPSTVQAVTPLLGSIACAAGANGNTSTAALAAIFATPGSGYALNPSWSGVDSVAAGAIALPAGLTPSATDVAGSPRVLNAAGTCAPGIQDKGAVELTGRGGVGCGGVVSPPPTPPAAAPAAPTSIAARITKLKLSPKAFAAAAKGASIAKAKAKAKVTGTTVSYRNSAAVTTRFTVQRALAGRRKGKTCAKPAPSNKRGKPCTRYSNVGAFTHKDQAGANSFRFTGRVGGRALAAGAYRLSAVPGSGAARGPAATATFTIVR